MLVACAGASLQSSLSEGEKEMWSHWRKGVSAWSVAWSQWREDIDLMWGPEDLNYQVRGLRVD